MATAACAKTAAAATFRWLVAPKKSVPSAFELERFVDLETPLVRLQQDWAILNCPIKKASGCGVHGQRVVEGLTLYARLLDSSSAAPDLTSALHIRVDDDPLGGMKAEFGLGSDDGRHIPIDRFRGFVADAFVLATDERSIFLELVFGLSEHGERKYYLIYDSAVASLSMVPCLPSYDFSVPYTFSPLRMTRGGGGGDDMAVLAHREVPPTPEEIEAFLAMPEEMQWMLEQMAGRKEDVVCVCSLAAAAPADEQCPWQVLRRNFPNQSLQGVFSVDVMFSFGGKAYWVDLAQGLVHCDWPPADGGAEVNFGFIALPPGCPPDERWTQPRFEPSDVFPMTTDRTMAYVAGSIKFVCMDRSQPLGDVTISVWNLDPATSVWTICKQFRAKQLRRLWSFKKEQLPVMEPRFPFMMEDGSLCLVIRKKPKRREDPPEDDFICNVELPILKVCWAGRLAQYHPCQHPIILPFDFFKLLNPLTPVQRNLRGIFRQ